MDEISEETRQAIIAVGDRLMALRKQHRRVDLTPFLLDMLDDYTDEDVLDHIRFSLQQEYQRHGNFEAASELALLAIARRPKSPMPLLIFASQKFFSEQDPAAALPLALKAVALADTAREFRRHTRAEVTRIAAALGDTDLVRKCLIEIMDMEFMPGEPDVGREADLLVHAKSVGVERETLFRYRGFLGPVDLPITSERPVFSTREDDI